MKRKLKWTAAVLAVLLLGLGAALLLWPRDRITPESWEKIEIGMTETRVEEILGRPGMSLEEFHVAFEHWEKSGKAPIVNGINFFEPQRRPRCGVGSKIKIWVGRRGHMDIEFDLEGQVTGKFFYGWQSSNRIDRLRDWLGW